MEWEKSQIINLNQLNILLADDDKDDCLFFKLALDSILLPFELNTVSDGEKLMDYLLKNSAKLPDVLFLDLNMPRKNGFECLIEIKANEQLKELPVIIYSTSFEQEVINQLYKSGAHYFMRKPAEIALLKKIIMQTMGMILLDFIKPKIDLSGYSTKQPDIENFVISLLEANS